MKKILATAGIGAALLTGACATNAHADNNGYHGSKGDHDARAYWLDTDPNPLRRPSNPAGIANQICSERQGGLSEAQVSYLFTHDLDGSYVSNSFNAASWVRAAEYHFCPKYY